MRVLHFRLWCLAIVTFMAASRVHGQDLDDTAPPLYLKFRVLSSLPWKEPGATRKTVLERIFREPHLLARREVLREYLHTALPVEEFPAAFDECIALEQADFPGAIAEFVMRAWAERDPTGAIHRCLTLFDLVIEGAPLEFDEWKTPIRVSNLEKARASNYWFGDRGVVHACWKGLAAAALSPERRKELEAAFRQAYNQRFQEDVPGDITEPSELWARHYQSSYVKPAATISSDAEMRSEFLGLLAAAPEEIPKLLKWPTEFSNNPTYPRALIRWMNGDGKKAPEIVERILDTYDPRHYYRGDTVVMEVIPTEFLMEWAILDPAGFMAWAGTESHGLPHTHGWRSQVVYLTVMSKESDAEVVRKTRELRHQESNPEFDALWITLDPHAALPWFARGDYKIDEGLNHFWRSVPPANYWRALITAFIDRNHRGGGNEAWGVTGVWGRIDLSAMVKQYGVPWCLRSGEYKRSEVPLMFSNRQPLESGSGLHNTVSALRTWAILRPKEMRAWIERREVHARTSGSSPLAARERHWWFSTLTSARPAC